MKGDPFCYHRPGEAGQKRLSESRRRFREVRDWLREIPLRELGGPASREISLAVTHLQEAMNHANCAIALADPDAEALED